MDNNNSNSLDVFIEGETIDLCIPSCDDNTLSQWYKWFNNSEITKYLIYGVYPNTINLQKEYCNSVMSDKTKIVLLIRAKDKKRITLKVVEPEETK